MKDAERKARIRAMLAAEDLATGHDRNIAAAWQKFKTQAVAEAEPVEIPPLRIVRRKFWHEKPQIFAAAALLFVVGAVYLFNAGFRNNQTPPVAGSAATAVASRQHLARGAVFRQERRQITVLSGAADLAQAADGRFEIQTTALQARFRLNQPTDLVIRHPLLTVTVTGTEFIFAADANTGSVRLTEGKLRIRYRGASTDTLLVAPAMYRFTETAGWQQTQNETANDRKLLRYDLVSGETFFAWQISAGTKTHEVQLLGGKKRTIPVEEIFRAEIAEPE